MSGSEPFDQIVGPAQIYLATVGASIPAVNATPDSNWFLLGPTDGEQTVQHGGSLEFFNDNDHQGPVKATRPEEMKVFSFSVVGLTLEDYARVINAVADLVNAAGPPATRTMGLKRGFIPTEYAMLFKGASHSPYGDFPAMYVVPRGVFDGEPEPGYAKDGRAALDVDFTSLEDPDTATEANKLGYLIAQTS